MADRLHALVERHLVSHLPDSAPVLVAYSGGLDSACLLEILVRLAAERGLTLGAVTVDHGLRSFAAEAKTTAEFCRTLGVSHQLVSLPPGLAARAKEAGRSLAERARAERYEVLRRVAAGGSIFLGHHLDDQAETILLRMMRGTGLQGLAAMRPVAGDLHRPLLAASRAQLEQYASRHRVPSVEDPSNRSPQFLRNRVRHEVLPMLESLGEGFTANLARSADVIADQAAAFATLLEEGLAARAERTTEGLSVPLAALRSGPLGRAQLHWLLAQLLPQPPASRQVEALAQLVTSREGTAELTLQGGIGARREYDTLLLFASKVESACPGTVFLRGTGEACWGRWVVRARDDVAPPDVPQRPPNEVWLSREISWPLMVRGWCRGDRMQPFGMSGTRLLSDLLGEARVPRPERAMVPVVIDGDGRIVWVPGVRRSHCAPVTAGQPALCLTCVEASTTT